ncbi:hypothetical protein BV25DRAFT_1816158 [Artomyces pyxidatus]|uniref:Uncharacterized protein n=1 Tax=Artomyces pyxidatus TaxID=48021 RepID=A0ACB8SH87_9AGAM|nr:hypothetical protein BV25DRAFT_1816158 [Artomyces pyxidatus]
MLSIYPRSDNRERVQDYPLATWREYRNEYLRECLRLEGRGNDLTNTICPDCRSETPEGVKPTVRCVDCYGRDMVCEPCVVRRHQRTPLHRVERWTGSFFETVSLQELGLRVQLGHAAGHRCKFPEAGPGDFTVIHINGVHDVALDFCGCTRVERRVQLIRAAWWPATPLDPHSAATFAALNTFHRLNLQGKLNVYDYWNTIVIKTDNTGLKPPPDRLPAFTLMAREFSHVKMGKRAGRGHVENGMDSVSPGELAIRCAACPRPGFNSPPSLEHVPESQRWVYRPIFCMDANFRLKNRLRVNGARDVSLRGASGYFVEPEGYAHHILNAATQDEICNCVGFSAINNANSKRSKGLCVTGVGAVTCRHEFWQPNGVGDLQKGERYCNMDFIFFSAFSHSRNKSGVVSYDIACQWSKNLWKRVDELPTHLRIPSSTDFTFAVPKFHLPAHGVPCQGPYSFNFLNGVGRTDGEGVERNWANMNGAASSTKQMGPGARQDALDNHCGHANWRKTIGFGKSLLRRMIPAISEALKHRRVFSDFQKILEKEQPEPGTAALWEKEVLLWEKDHSLPCPYDMPASTITLDSVQLDLAKEDAEKGAKDGVLVAMSSAELFLLAMEIEEVQRGITADNVSKPTAHQAARLQERRNALAKRLVRFRVQAAKTFPLRSTVITSEHAHLCDAEAARPDKVVLPLPSSTPSALRAKIYSQDAIETEKRLRYAEAFESLDRVRHHLRMRSYLNAYKVKNTTGQAPNTRARNLQSQVDVKVHAAAKRYRHARRLYAELAGDGDWQDELQELLDEDIRGLSERAVRVNEAEEENVDGGEGKRTLSWLWYGAVSAESEKREAGMHAAVRTEWAKARARALRWTEEVVMVRAEMQRVLITLTQEAMQWTALVDRLSVSDAALTDGLNAFAREQSSLRVRLATSFQTMWAIASKQADEFLTSPDLQESQELAISEAIQAVRIPRSRNMDDEYASIASDHEFSNDVDDDDD